MSGIGLSAVHHHPEPCASIGARFPALTLKHQALVKRSMGFVRDLAKLRHRRAPGVRYDELVAVGYHVLAELAPRYDETRGTFRAFATLRVNGAMLSYVRAILEQHGAHDRIPVTSNTMRTRSMGLLLGESDGEQIDELALTIIDGVVAYLGDSHVNYVENEQVERLHREKVAGAANAFVVALTEKEATIFRRHLLENASFPEIATQLSTCSRTARRVFERVSARLRVHLRNGC